MCKRMDREGCVAGEEAAPVGGGGVGDRSFSLTLGLEGLVWCGAENEWCSQRKRRKD